MDNSVYAYPPTREELEEMRRRAYQKVIGYSQPQGVTPIVNLSDAPEVNDDIAYYQKGIYNRPYAKNAIRGVPQRYALDIPMDEDYRLNTRDSQDYRRLPISAGYAESPYRMPPPPPPPLVGSADETPLPPSVASPTPPTPSPTPAEEKYTRYPQDEHRHDILPLDCRNISYHISACPMCSHFYKCDKTPYIIAICFLALLVVVLLKMVLDKKN